VRFISHLDLLRELERSLRRAAVPVLYSEGYSPRPKVSAAPALALGWTSDSEWIDLELAGEWPEQRLAGLLEDLNAVVAPGITFTTAASMPSKVASLVAGIEQSTYVARFPRPNFDVTLGKLTQAADGFMSQQSVTVVRERKRKRREIDLRPMVHEFAVVAEDEIILRIMTASGRSAKPTEVLQAALGLNKDQVPLVQLHKLEATLASGDCPTAGAIARAEVTDFETRNTDYSPQPTRNARGHTGGRSTC
jgi:radical SAM-linked protein